MLLLGAIILFVLLAFGIIFVAFHNVFRPGHMDIPVLGYADPPVSRAILARHLSPSACWLAALALRCGTSLKDK